MNSARLSMIQKSVGSFRKPVRKGIVSPMRAVPQSIMKPEYYESGIPFTSTSVPKISTYTGSDLAKIRYSAKLAREMLEYACSLVKVGRSTDEIDALTHEKILQRGAYPSPINFAGFPKAICTSVNEVCCHGIPDNRPLEDGDIVSIDVSVFKDGFHGDNCKTVIVNEGDDEAEALVKVTQQSLLDAIETCRPGSCLSEVGNVIEKIAHQNKFQVIHEFMGHGTGPVLHMYPLVAHYRNTKKLTLQTGMVFTIEPILCEGSRRITTWSDNWTAVMGDGKRSAQFEHEILISDEGAEILTVI